MSVKVDDKFGVELSTDIIQINSGQEIEASF